MSAPRRPVSTVVALSLLATLGGCSWGGVPALERVERAVAARYDLPQLEPQDLARELDDSPGDVLLLDVRSPEEYAVSHLKGALRVDPEAAAQEVVERWGSELAGRRVVLYCAVGVRSAGLGERIEEAALAAGAASVSNLSGGIFRWRNEGRPLVDAAGPTPYVHPFSSRWSRLLADPAWARVTPGTSSR